MPVYPGAQVINFVVVEAAGVEPASEKARNEENYVRSTIQLTSASASESARMTAA
jgi:hypothetical protein